jgi:transcriptional regulator with GAF, ATPase, and Fis domain
MKLTRDFSLELTQLNKALGTDFAIISHIKDKDYFVLQVASELKMINIGDQYETVNTYCNEVMETRHIVTYDKVGAIRAMTLHPIYTAMQLEAYVGEPLFFQNSIVGTLNFSGFDPKSPGFCEEDIAQVKALAREIEANIIEDD